MVAVGRRSARGDEWADQGRLARTAALLRGGGGVRPPGGFRLFSFRGGRGGVGRGRRALSVLADNAAAEVADDDLQRHVVVRVADEVVVDLMGRACGLSY